MPGITFTLLLGFVPAPPEVVDAVQSIEIEASTDVASVCRLRLGIAQTKLGDWSVLEKDFFRPLLPLAVRLTGGIGIPQAVFNGYVTHLDAVYPNEPGSSTLEVTALDLTHLMNLEEKARAWPNMPDGAIVAAIFGQYGAVPLVQPTTPQLVEPEGTTTQRDTDIRFVKKLAQRNGFDCYVQPEPITGIDQAYFQPPPAPFGPPQAVVNVGMGPDTNVEGFRVGYEMTRPTSAVAAVVDASTKAVLPALAPLATRQPMGLEPALLRLLPPPIARPADTGALSIGELQPLVQSIVDESSWALVAEGTVGLDSGILRPGKLINVRGAGRLLSGSYLATRIGHSVTRAGSYTQTFRARRNAVGMTGAELFVALP